ncbi:hypothetical protein [Levilactobacillus yiduensis]|uniref:hypothetical protein n=1 Tax=Levilactobacillus yiduensis TaxID=2953880 RepID=UPI000EF3009D|nr:hypothetical protein [Levilactobacillus yiduensis]AYM03955.1 hypothetical protein D8911_13575 [Levilactobacillus brevis]
MIKNKVMTSIMVASATLGLALVIPTFTGSNQVSAQASGGYTYEGKTYKTEKEVEAAVNKTLTSSQKKAIAQDKKEDSADNKAAVASIPKGKLRKVSTKKSTTKKTTKKKATKKYAYKVSKLTSKKTKSNKYVKVNGTIKVSTKSLAAKHHAKWARITTYKGYKYVRLSKKGTFKKTIKAPKAKHTWAKAGYYTKKVKNGKVVKKHGKIVYTFHLLSSSKKVTVKAYK